MDYSKGFKLSTQDELNKKLKDDTYIKDFWNEVIFNKPKMSKPRAWSKVFGVDYPLSDSMTTKLYRWLRKPEVAKIGEKVNKGLEVDLLDNKIDILSRLHKIATDTLEDNYGEKINVPIKLQAETGKAWLDAIKQDKSININMGEGTQVNIVQLVQDKLSAITQGATIQPDIKQVEYIDAEVDDNANS